MSKKNNRKSDSSKSKKVINRTTTRHTPRVSSKATQRAADAVINDQIKVTQLTDTRAETAALVAALAGQLRDPIAEHAITAIESLGQTRDVGAVEPLAGVVQNHDGYFHLVTRAAAAMALGQLGQAAAIPVLVSAANDSMAEVSCEAILALGQLRATEAVNMFSGIVSNQNGYYLNVTRHAAIRALGQIGEKSVKPVLENVINNTWEDHSIQSAAQEAIAKLK